MEFNIVKYLLAYSSLAALIGVKLDPVELAEKSAPPAVVYRVIGKPRETSWGDRFMRMQFDCYGTTYKQAKSVATALSAGVEAIDGNSKIFASYVDNEIDWVKQSPGEPYRTIIDAVFYFNV